MNRTHQHATQNPRVKPLDEEQTARALGAQSRQRLDGRPSLTVADLDTLSDSLADRLTSSGGRPTDPAWTLTRRVPFTPKTWETLQSIAHALGTNGRSVAPAQLAASLVEERVAELDAVIRSRSTHLRSQDKPPNR